jgi:hypothetical protein
MPKCKRRAGRLVGSVQRFNGSPHEGRFARAQRSGKCDDVARVQPPRELGRKRSQSFLVRKRLVNLARGCDRRCLYWSSTGRNDDGLCRKYDLE